MSADDITEEELDELLGALADAPSVPLDPIGPGSVLGPYRVESALGRGGMGRVFRATDMRLDRAVALKVLDRSGSRARDAILREARAAASVSHPALVTVYDVGESDDGYAYVAMELVEGTPLERPTSAKDARRLARTIAEALAALHRGGLIHLDLKPSNVMVLADGSVKLVDFGLAARVADPSAPRGGTPEYVSPEVRDGGEPTLSSDVFAFGVLLRWLGSGVADGIAPFGLRNLAEACTRPMPEHRPKDGAALVARIERGERSRQLLVGLLMALGIVGATSLVLVRASCEKQSRDARPTVEEAPPVARARPADDWERLTDLDSSAMLFEGVQSPDGSQLAYAERRGVFVRDLASGDARRITDAAIGAHCVAFEPGGAGLWIGGAEGIYRAVLGEQTGEPEVRRVLEGNGCPVPSPDGRWLTVERPDRLELVDAESLEVRTLIGPPLVLVASAFSPSGDRLATLRVHETDEGAATTELSVMAVPDGEPTVLHADPSFWMPTHGVSVAWLDAESLLVGHDPNGDPQGERQLLRTPATEWAPVPYATLPFDSCRLSVDDRGRVVATSHSQEKELMVAPLTPDGIGELERISRSLAILRPSGWSADGQSVLVDEQQGQTFRAIRHPLNDDTLPEPLVPGPATWPQRAGEGLVYWRPPSAETAEATLVYRDPEGREHVLLRAAEPPPGAAGWRRPPPVSHWAECDPDRLRCIVIGTGETPFLRWIALPSGDVVIEVEPPESAVAGFSVLWNDEPEVAIPIRGEPAIDRVTLPSGATRRVTLPEGCDGHQLTHAPEVIGPPGTLLLTGWCRPPDPYRVLRIDPAGESTELFRSTERLLGDPRVDPSGSRLALHAHTFRSNIWRLPTPPNL